MTFHGAHCQTRLEQLATQYPVPRPALAIPPRAQSPPAAPGVFTPTAQVPAHAPACVQPAPVARRQPIDRAPNGVQAALGAVACRAERLGSSESAWREKC